MEKNLNYNKVMVHFLKKVIDQLKLETYHNYLQTSRHMHNEKQQKNLKTFFKVKKKKKKFIVHDFKE